MVTNEYDFEVQSTFKIYSVYVLLMWIVYDLYMGCISKIYLAIVLYLWVVRASDIQVMIVSDGF